MRTSEELHAHVLRVMNAIETIMVALPGEVDDHEPFTNLVMRSAETMEGAALLREMGLDYAAAALANTSNRLALRAFVVAGYEVLTDEQDADLYADTGHILNDHSIQESMAILNDEFVGE